MLFAKTGRPQKLRQNGASHGGIGGVPAYWKLIEHEHEERRDVLRLVKDAKGSCARSSRIKRARREEISISPVNHLAKIEEKSLYGIVSRQPLGAPPPEEQASLSQSVMPGVFVSQPDVSIIGLACRFSGGEGYRSFWSHLAAGDDLVTEIPAERWPIEGFYSRDFEAPDRSASKWGSFLERVDEFDHRFFEISPREARSMDPQQRLLLEEVWRCVEDSGIALSRLREKRTGIFVGMMSLDYAQRVQQSELSTDAFACPGTFSCILANRVSYFLGLTGPSISLDTACSSSLVALHQARQALLAGEVDYALVAGVSLNLTPWKYLSFSKARMLSPEGRCRTFDQSANGYVPGEGVGVLLLQRGEEAAGERNFVHGVIKGSAVNHGGAAVSLTAPRVAAQKDVILAAYTNAGISPESVSYVEAHGTGTNLGDPIEFEALTQAFREHTREEQFCWLGSVKTNIGHLEPAAGIAGVIKVLLMMRERQIPKSLHLRKANPMIELKGSPFRLAEKLAPWEGRNGLRRAGVSSFGFGGVNSHVLLEAPAAKTPEDEDESIERPFLLSAKTETSLRDMVKCWIDFTESSEFRNASWRGITATLLQREPFAHRIALWVTKGALREALMGAGQQGVVQATKSVRVVLGSFAKMRSFGGLIEANKWSELGVGPDSEHSLARDFCAAVFWGTRAKQWVPGISYFTGEGVGFHAALCVCGCLNEKEVLQFLVSDHESASFELKRPQFPVYDPLGREFLQPAELPSNYFENLLRTAVLPNDQWQSLVERARELLPVQHTFRKLLERWAAFLGWNGKDISRWFEHAVTASGEGQLLAFAIGDALRALHKKWELPNRAVSSQFDEVLQLLADGLLEARELIAFLRSGDPFSFRIKNVRNIENYPFLQSLLEEAKPRTITLRKSEFTAQAPESNDHATAVIGAVKAGDRTGMVVFDPSRPGDDPGRWLARLWSTGVEIDWSETPWTRDFSKVPLPVYRFDRTRFWIDREQPESSVACPLSRDGKDSRLFRGKIDRSPLIESHQIGGEPLVPGALWLGAGCRAYAEFSGREAFAVRDFEIVSPLWVKNEEAFEIGVEGNTFTIRSNGKICSKGEVATQGARSGKLLKPELLRCGSGDSGAVYDRFKERGYEYGEPLQVIRGVRRAEDRVVARIEFSGADEWNPFFLDGLLQAGLVAALEFGLLEKGLWLPCRISEIQNWKAQAGARFAVVEKSGIRASAGELVVDVLAYSERGDPVAEIKELCFRRFHSIFGRQRPSGKGEGSAFISPDQGSINGGLEELKFELRQILVGILQVDAKEVDEETDLREYGMESISFTEYAEAIGARYQVEVDPVLLYEQPSIEGLARALCRMFPEKLSKEVASVTPGAAEESSRESAPCLEGTETSTPGAVAIIGMAGRFPKSANLEEYWRNLVSGKDLITEVPKSRWNWEEHFGDPNEEGNKTRSKWGGFVDDVDRFDAGFFRISPREAELMDPQQRWLLELAWEVMEDAGHVPSKAKGSAVGVFIGVCNHDYQDLVARSEGHGQAQAATGNYFSILPNRISYFFDWKGPSLAIDTACSSSLVALDCAIKALAAGDCGLAIAGGVNLCCTPGPYLSFSHAGMLSPDGRCKSFSAAGNGYVRGEGAGLILLKPLARALADGDPIHAVVRGVAVNHGGAATSLTAPNPNAQAELIVKACRRAGVAAQSIGYIEAHGTGTQLGDPIEAAGLASAFQELGIDPSVKLPFCGLGSVKTNIGHLESAAGIAGLIKVVLALRHGLIPASLHCEELNSHIDLRKSPFYVVKEATPWPAAKDANGEEMPRRAGVSSFGFGGANAHAIIEKGPALKDPPVADKNELLVISARSEKQLKEAAKRLCEWFQNWGANASWRDIAHTLQTGREAFEWRLALVAGDKEEARELLMAFLAGNSSRPNLWVEHSSRSELGKLQDSPEEREFCAALARTGNLRKLAGFWVSGSRVPFAELFKGGKRISLPNYPFADERYWVGRAEAGGTERAVQIQEAAETAGHVLFRKDWQERPLNSRDGAISGRFLLVVDGARAEGVRIELEKRLEVSWIVVTPGEAFDAKGSRIEGIVHLIGGDDRGAVDSRVISFYQEQISRRGAGRLSVILVTEGVQAWQNTRPSLRGAALTGLVRMLGAEHAGLRARAIDVLSFGDAADVARLIWNEAGSDDHWGEVCHRNGQRFVPALTVHPAGSAPPVRLSAEKVYVITGGTGGIGLLLADYLARNGARKLVLMGRRTVPERGHWKAELQRLVERGVALEVSSTPLTDGGELGSFFQSVRKRHGPIGGVIHCAGEVDANISSLVNKDPESFERILSPKVEGTQILARQFEEDRLDFFILFSSISAIVPALAVGYSDYAAANSFLDFFAAWQQSRGKTWFRAVNWPLWEGVGMGRGVHHAKYLEVGLAPLSSAEGLELFGRILSLREPGNIFVAATRGDFSVDGLLTIKRLEASEPAESLREQVIEAFAKGLKIPAAQLDQTVSFAEFGVDSIILAEITRKLDKVVGSPVDPSLLLEHRNIAALTEHLGKKFAQGLKTAPQRGSVAASPDRARPEPIAVIGMGCRFPRADDVEEFWQNLRQGIDCVREVPKERWASESIYDSEPASGGSISKWGGFLDGIDLFDPGFFGLSDEEAEHLDPLARLFMEVSVQCVRNAGYGEKELRGRRVGVFAGSRSSEYANLIREFRKQTISGIGQNFIAAHVSQYFDFRGPNLVVDTACSSSATSVHLACQSIWAGESEMALAGGVDLLLSERVYVLLTQAKALSPDGRCHAFDVKANGYVPGEGCGAVLLKPLRAARQDGDRIEAVILGSAVNNDGCTMGITTPSLEAQQEVIGRALAAAGVEAGSVNYVEAHGTGTMIGDPIELRALTQVFRRHTGENQFCALGSVKTNLGHLHSAAGIASLIKVALALRHREIPPTLHCETPNPRFDFADSPFYPNVELRPWGPRGGRRRAAVSSFGFGGTNCHLILEGFDASKYPDYSARRAALPPAEFHRKRVWVDAVETTETSSSTQSEPELFLVLQEEEG